MTETDSQPIAENEQVKELLALLKDNNTPGYEEFSKLIEHVTGMEQRLLEATEELKAVRQEMQGLQNHSLKDALQKSYTAMEANISVMLLYDEAPVYRLLPSGSEKIAPIVAISTGLWYENYREFAIAPEDLGALDKLIRRETDRLTGNLPQLHKNEERRPAPER